MFKNEKSFYEIQEYWELERYQPIEFERAAITINWIPEETESVLDLGCGNGIITNQILKNKVVGVDRSVSALTHVSVLKCQADICYLPFPSDSFDIVLCSEVIEHIPNHNYHQALQEIVRVASKHILITVPYKEDLQAQTVICPSCGCVFHKTYHMRGYFENDLIKLFEYNNQKWTLVRISAIGQSKSRLFGSTIKRLTRIIAPQLIEYPFLTICPQCGYRRHGNSITDEFRTNKKKLDMNVIQLLKKIWPVRSIPSWWIALYKRNEDK